MFKITVNKNGLIYSARFNNEQECLTWVNRVHPNSQYQIEDITSQVIHQKLWESCNDYCLSKIDSNDRARYSAWLVLGNNTQKQMVADNIAWVDSVWVEYYNRKANLTENYDWSSFGNPPHTFYEIAQSV